MSGSGIKNCEQSMKQSGPLTLIQTFGGNLVAALLLGSAMGAFAASSPAPAPVRERVSFNSGWLFTKGDPEGKTNVLSYANIKDWVKATGNAFTTNAPHERPTTNPGEDVAYTGQGFDDTAWRKLNLPHDWGIEGPFKQEYPGETGKLPWWGVGWYRKHFDVAASDAGQADFIWKWTARWPTRPSGSTASMSAAGLTVMHRGSSISRRTSSSARENVLAIRLDNPPDSSRWYPGGGIYRNVWLVKTAPVHVGHWGTYVTTPEVSSHRGDRENPASTSTTNRTPMPPLTVRNEIFELDAAGKKGKPLAAIGTPTASASRRIRAARATSQVALKSPKLWSLQKPHRYAVVTTLIAGRQGDRSLRNAVRHPHDQVHGDKGFLLNGERVPLNGVCDHHDLGALGLGAQHPRAGAQLEILKEMGCNAIRTSHNPPAPELLDLADRWAWW